MTGSFGSSGYGSGPYGSQAEPFTVTDASAGTPTTVEISFSHPLDYAYAPLSQVSNYSIPGLTVLSVVGGSYNTVILATSLQSYTNYTVTVLQAVTDVGVPLEPNGRTAEFTGYFDSMIVVPISSTRIRLQFSEAMLVNAALTDPASYTITALATGTPVAVAQVTLEQPSTPQSLILVLSGPLTTDLLYRVEISDQIVTFAGGFEVFPKVHVVVWKAPTRVLSVSTSEFSGEVTTGILGEPAGLVFFSPALETAVPSSVIEIDEVSVCALAYDSYEIPSPPDPPALYCWAAGVTSVLGSSVCWAGIPRLSDVRFDVGVSHQDTKAGAVDGKCTATLQALFDPNYVSLLNNPEWHCYDGTPRTFICANNTGPIPPGGTTVIVIVP